MRDILFRGKRVDNGEWCFGWYFKFQDMHFILPLEVKDSNHTYLWDYAIEVLPKTVGQYTGLTDKNGVKVFEGDILKQKTTEEFKKYNFFEWEQYGIVRFGYYDWKEGCHGHATMCWYIEPLKSVSIKPKNYLVGHIQAGLNQCDILDKYYPMEVIGNIHDNLKGEEQ